MQTFGTFNVPTSWSWRIPSAIQALPSVIQVVLVLLVLPESPRWLIKKGRDEDAARSMSRLTGAPPTDQAITDDLNDIRASLEEERQ